MEKTVYRGADKKFGLSIENSLWKALYFTHDYNFAKKFGFVKRYKIKPKKLLNLTIESVRNIAFNKMADGYTEPKKLEQIYNNGDFPYRQTDNFGFSFTLLDMILDYAKKNNYDTIKMVEYYSKTVTPTIFIVLDIIIVKEIN
jgi:hypothetical protein